MFNASAEQWSRLFNGSNIELSPVPVDLLEATFVDSKDRERDSYGDFYEGDGEIYVIFKVGNKFYKKTGYRSSYGDGLTWDGDVTEVTPETKTVTVTTYR